MRNELQQLEPPGTRSNKLEPPGTRWNLQELALERGLVLSCSDSFESKGFHMTFLRKLFTH